MAEDEGSTQPSETVAQVVVEPILRVLRVPETLHPYHHRKETMAEPVVAVGLPLALVVAEVQVDLEQMAAGQAAAQEAKAHLHMSVNHHPPLLVAVEVVEKAMALVELAAVAEAAPGDHQWPLRMAAATPAVAAEAVVKPVQSFRQIRALVAAVSSCSDILMVILPHFPPV